MKMIYQTRHTSNNDNKRVVVKLLLVLVFIFVFSFVKPFRFLILNSLAPFFESGNYLNNVFLKIPKSFLNKNEIIIENEKLLSEIEGMKIDLIDYELIKNENKKLTESLGFLSDSNLLGAKIVARSPQISFDTLLLNQGLKGGVNEGDYVLASSKILVGQITKVFQNQSIVALSSFPLVESFGFVERTNEVLEIKGEGGGSLEAEVPIDFDIQINDKIIKEGQKDYVIAIVSSIEEDLSLGFKKVLLSLPLNIFKTRILFIEKILKE